MALADRELIPLILEAGGAIPEPPEPEEGVAVMPETAAEERAAEQATGHEQETIPNG